MNLTELIATLTAVGAAAALSYFWLRPRRTSLPRTRAPAAPPAERTSGEAATRLRRELAERAQAARRVRAQAKGRAPADQDADAGFAPTTLLEDELR